MPDVRRLLLGTAIPLCCLALAAPGMASAHTDAPHVAAETASWPIPDKGLLDQHGQAFDADGLAGRTVLVHVVYTSCPGPCPTQTSRLVALQQALPSERRDRFHLLSISIDPGTDSPRALLDYAVARGVSLDNWTLVTGAGAALDALRERFGARVDVASTTASEQPLLLDHTLDLYLLDASGNLVQVYPGDVGIARLAADMQSVDRLLGPDAP